MTQSQSHPDTIAAASAPVFERHQDDSSPISAHHESWPTSPSNFDGDTDVDRDAYKRSLANRPPANAPKGPAADRFRGQNQGSRPPPNAPTGPAAHRKKEVNRNHFGRSHQQPVTLAVAHPNSKSWASKDYGEMKMFEKGMEQMKYRRMANSPCVPRTASEYMILREENLQKAKQHIAWKKQHDEEETDDRVSNNKNTSLPCEKLSSRELFPRRNAQIYWHAGSTKDLRDWPTPNDFKNHGDRRNEQGKKQILPPDQINEFQPIDSRKSNGVHKDAAASDDQQIRLEELSERCQELIKDLIDAGDEKNTERYV
ncbi:hypothetical protein GCG54_00003312 [Colletotrichum gloeosporioides]|uniref:Uncharacterized protein n=1 Tax=Colletotrichum gloeosporioides TaxID=474922 RepID=A0A8H4CEX2_COLGL|nr:uncharacterized protein GCG54_00003312 [Colletotrichum gloeosporioides]KAF3802507.1 hypothetical protein GCG54_00003312 [Colletotrichum gloeosporioides]